MLWLPYNARTVDTMNLAPGTRIGSYEVVSIAGAGGMGEVYRARDTRLRRDVGIKILPLPDDPNAWIPTKDGQRFLVNVRVTKARPAPIEVVLNWSEQAGTQ